MKKRAPKTFFSDFRLLFGIIFSALFGDFGDVGATYFSEGVRDRFGTVFGSILEVFWTDFGGIFGIILEVFFMKNVVLPAWELIFQKMLCFSLFICCWRAAQKQQFYLHGSSIFENLLVISVGFFGNAEIVKKCGFPVFLF